jgi:hypothetical protein
MNATIRMSSILQKSSCRSKCLISTLGTSLTLLLLAPHAEASWRTEGFTIKDISTGSDGRVVFTLNGDTHDFCGLGRDDLRGAYTIPGDGANKPNSAMFAVLMAAYLAGKPVGAQNIDVSPNCDFSSFRYHLPIPDEVWIVR